MSQQRVLLVDLHTRPATLQRAATRVGGRALGLVVGLLALFTLAGLLYLSQASTAAEMRYALAQEQRDALALQERVTVLRCQIARGASITGLEERSSKLGLVDASSSDPRVVCDMPPPPASVAGEPAALGAPH